MERLENHFVINDKQYNNLCNELAKLLKKYKNDSDVECIYFTSLIISNERHQLLITVVCSDIFKWKDQEIDFTRYNDSHQRKRFLKKYGLEIKLYGDISNKYAIIDLNEIENERKNSLFNSTILYDKTGIYTEIKEVANKTLEFCPKAKIKECGIFKYDNLVELVPKVETQKILQKAKVKS